MLTTQEAPNGKLSGSELILFVDFESDPSGSREAVELLHAVEPSIETKLVVQDVRGRGIGEQLPFLATTLGVLRGLDEIRYFADHLQRRVAAGSAA